MGTPRKGPAPPANRPRERLILAAVLAAVLVAFLPALRGAFVWDDVEYVVRNDSIRSLDPASLAALLETVQVGNYHPLTMLSLAIDHALFGLDPFGYHLVSVLLHLLNVFLVHRLVLDLSRRFDAAILAAAFWGLHPLRVESVAWVSGRKDLLYTAFFLVALLAYRRWTRHGDLRSYAASLGAYLLSLLSKGMAVSLALVLPASDFLDGRKLTRRAVLDKLPFLALSLAFGCLAIWAQRYHGAIEVSPRPLSERLLVASYGTIAYLAKTVAPVNLSALYPYPPGSLPASYAASLGALVAIGVAVAASLRVTRKVAFGMLFYLGTVALVLQVVPVGEAVIADRYAYLPGVGLAYLAGEGFAAAWSAVAAAKGRRLVLAAGGAAACILLAGLTFARCGVFRDSAALWNDVIAKHSASAIAYNNRGNARADLGDREGAERDYREAIRLDPDYALARYNEAYLAGEMGDFARAAAGLTRVIELAPDMAQARLHRGLAYLELRRARDAVADFDRAIVLAPDLAPAYAGRARAWLDLGDRARASADAALARSLGFALDPGFLAELEARP
jgi:tetratricopeptide (TPR) repeat protein